MKVKIVYSVTIEKDINISPEDYCELHASSNYMDNMFFPKGSFNRKIVLDEKAKNILDDYYLKNKG